MIVCICHRVSDRDIARAAASGCTSFEELQVDTGVATRCGKCHDCARQTFQSHAGAGAAPSGEAGVCFVRPLHWAGTMSAKVPSAMAQAREPDASAPALR